MRLHGWQLSPTHKWFGPVNWQEHNSTAFQANHYCTDSGSNRQHTRAKLERSYPGWFWVGGSGDMSFIFVCVNSWTKNACWLTQVRNHLSKHVVMDFAQWEAGAVGMVRWLGCLWWYPDELDVGSARKPNHPVQYNTHKELHCTICSRLHLDVQLAHQKHVGCCHLTSLNPFYGKHSKVQLSCMSHKVICACTKVPIETAMELSPDDELLWTWWHSSNDSWTKRKEGTLCRIVLKPEGRRNGIHICPFLSFPLSLFRLPQQHWLKTEIFQKQLMGKLITVVGWFSFRICVFLSV